MSLPLTITIDGYPATEIAPPSPPVYETWADGGCGSLSFDFAMSAKRGHHLLYPGALVEAFIGIRPVFSGRLSEPDRSEWSCTAYGHAAHAHKLSAFDMVGNTTRDVAVAAATARTAWGWQGADPSGVMTGVVAGDDTGPQYLGALFDQRSEELAKRWGVDARRRLFLRADPTETNLWLAPDVAALGQTEEGAVSHMAGRFLAPGGAYQTAFWPVGTQVTAIETVDLTGRGELSIIQATTILGGMLALRQARAAWTAGMTVHRSQLHSNGVPPFLPTLTAGQLRAQLVGLPAAFAAGTTQTAVIGKTRWDAASPDVIYLEPVNTAPRNLSDVIAA